MQIESSPGVATQFGKKIILFHPLAWEEHQEAPRVPGASLAQGL